MLSKNQLGFLYMFISICAFSLMDIIVKWSVDYPIGQVLFFRGFFGIIFYFFIIPRERLHNFYQTKRAGLHLLRCLSGLIALVSIFIALRELPLATVVSISFASPIFATILSIFFLSLLQLLELYLDRNRYLCLQTLLEKDFFDNLLSYKYYLLKKIWS